MTPVHLWWWQRKSPYSYPWSKLGENNSVVRYTDQFKNCAFLWTSSSCGEYGIKEIVNRGGDFTPSGFPLFLYPFPSFIISPYFPYFTCRLEAKIGCNAMPSVAGLFTLHHLQVTQHTNISSPELLLLLIALQLVIVLEKLIKRKSFGLTKNFRWRQVNSCPAVESFSCDPKANAGVFQIRNYKPNDYWSMLHHCKAIEECIS